MACIEPRLRLPEATMTWEPDTSTDLEEKLAVDAATNLGDIRAVTWAEVREHALREFFQFKDGHSTVDGVILYNKKTVFASPLRALILDTLLSAHQGVSCMTSSAKFSVFWPGITLAIANLRARCRSCNERAPSNHMALRSRLRKQFTPSSASVRKFQIQGLQIHGGCGPLLWLADCAVITRWFFGSCKTPSRNFCHIRHCR